jgi:hypothetical protein
VTLNILVTIYFGVAVFTGVWVFYHGVIIRPRPKLFATREFVALALTCVVVGLGWALFLPVLTMLALQSVLRWFGADPRAWLVHGQRAARVRA